ncbi:MAG: two-component regulator propeller domain-containing protein [bacterium]
MFPSVQTVYSLIRIGADLWGGTNGCLFRLDLQTEAFQIFTNADGLSSNHITAMVQDNRGNLILGTADATLDIFNLNTFQVTTISDFKLNNKIFQIYALYADSGKIYVGTDIGVSRMAYNENLNRYLIEGNYINLGDTTFSEIPVGAIQIFDGGIWVGTEKGLARGDLDAQYLELPSNWMNYTTAQGLSSNSVSALCVFRDTLYVACDSTGLNRFNGIEFEPLLISNGQDITLLKSFGDTLFVGRPGGIYYLQGNQLIRYGADGAAGLCLEFAADGAMWSGREMSTSKLGGLQKYSGSDWIYLVPEGPRGEIITDILVENDGSLWVTGILGGSGATVSFSNGGLFHFDGQHWINLSLQDEYISSVSPCGFFGYQMRGITKDLFGTYWIASDGRGVAWFSYENDTLNAIAYYPASTGRLYGVAGAPDYCVVRDLLSDPWGNIWICNSEADPTQGEPIAIIPADFLQDSAAFPNWYYTTVSIQPQQAQYYVDRIILDTYGRKWLGANNNITQGIHILDDNGTPLNDSDDTWTQLADAPSEKVNSMVCDRDGVVWVGTPEGVRYFYPSEDIDLLYGYDLYVPVGQNVKTVAVDPQNNKWFGTTSGVSVLGADNFTWKHHYTTLDGAYPSPLPGNAVQAIAFDATEGYAYLGTDNGLVRLTTPYKGMGQSVTSISVWPNPFLLQDGLNARLIFEPMGLSETAEVRIFTASGIFVRRLNVTDINIGWDGRNANGELVGTGVYLLLAYAPDGSTQVGKVAVVHK